MSSSLPFDAVLIVSFGGPQGPDDIRPFLQNVLRGRRVPPERIEEVAHHYELFGGVSPLTRLTERQGVALKERLKAHGLVLPVYIGMRNWHPHLADTLRQMREDGVERAIGLIAAAHRSYSSCTQYKHNVLRAQSELAADRWLPPLGAPQEDASEPEPPPDAWSKPGVPDIVYTDDWHTHPGFIEAVAAQIEQARATLPADALPLGALPHDARAGAKDDAHAGARIIFTAHSIPTSMAHADTYQRQLRESAAAVAARLGTDDWTLVYQSRSGRPQDPWLEPDINDYLRSAHAEGLRTVILSPLGFVCDHVEVLYDLDVEARATCNELGIVMARAAAVNDHPRFIDALTDAVLAIVERYRKGRPLTLVSATEPNPQELAPPVRG